MCVIYSVSAILMVSLYSVAPPIMKISSSVVSCIGISSSVWTTVTFGHDSDVLCVKTIFLRLGKAPLGNDSKVFRPMTTVCPDVSVLKCFKSLGKWHNSCWSRPMAPFSATAAINAILLILIRLLFLRYGGEGYNPSIQSLRI